MVVIRRVYLLTSWWLLIAQLDESINQNVFLSSVTQAASAVASLFELSITLSQASDKLLQYHVLY